eukprot:Nk52_evm2s1394 gene=Nk52_evmTU2s1394
MANKSPKKHPSNPYYGPEKLYDEINNPQDTTAAAASSTFPLTPPLTIHDKSKTGEINANSEEACHIVDNEEDYLQYETLEKDSTIKDQQSSAPVVPIGILNMSMTIPFSGNELSFDESVKKIEERKKEEREEEEREEEEEDQSYDYYNSHTPLFRGKRSRRGPTRDTYLIKDNNNHLIKVNNNHNNPHSRSRSSRCSKSKKEVLRTTTKLGRDHHERKEEGDQVDGEELELSAPVGKTLGVFGMSRFTSSSSLHYLFSQYGEIDNISVIMNRDSSGSRGYAFIRFFRQSDATIAQENLNGIRFHGRNIRVAYAFPKNSII